MGKWNEHYTNVLAEFKKAGNRLIVSLLPEQKELIEDYMTAHRETNSLTDCKIFCYVFKLGTKAMDGMMKKI